MNRKIMSWKNDGQKKKIDVKNPKKEKTTDKKNDREKLGRTQQTKKTMDKKTTNENIFMLFVFEQMFQCSNAK